MRIQRSKIRLSNFSVLRCNPAALSIVGALFLAAVVYSHTYGQSILSISDSATWDSRGVYKQQFEIRSLELKVITADLRGAGTDNAVYFDVGPWAWRLNKRWHNDFERGHTDSFPLEVPTGFRLNDILWLRLHKKGLLGVTGTRDGLAGAWHPQRVTLLVNGAEYASADISQPLNSRFWFWQEQRDFDPYANPANFVLSLRLVPNKRLTWLDRKSGFATTPLFKERNISGWLSCPEDKQGSGGQNACSRVPATVCATSEVFRDPAVSNDGLASIDLSLEALEFCSDRDHCTQRAVVKDVDVQNRPRYLRVEYRHRGNCVPKKQAHVRICGRLLWDTDREGWWEIHTSDPADVIVTGKPGAENNCRQRPARRLK